MDGHEFHGRREHFCCYYWQTFWTAVAVKCHIKDCFKFDGKQRIKILAKGEYVRFKTYERNIIYDLFIFCVLTFEDNRKQNSNESYINKYQNHVSFKDMVIN